MLLRDGMNTRSLDGFMTPEIAAQLREIGALIDPPATAAIYVPLHEVTAQTAIPVRNLRYGPYERNVLDVFSQATPGDDAPVLVFIHGGGFQRGAKSSDDSPFYDNIMRWAAEQGFVGVNINYRLAPEFVWPAGIEDLRALVGWLDENIAGYGGDPRKVFLWGHSAGAGHVADYIAEQVRDARGATVRGAILLSGMYELGSEVSIWSAYYGDDVAEYPRRSAASVLPQTQIPLMLVDADLDPEWAKVQAQRLSQIFDAAGTSLERLHLAGHSHLSESYAVGTADRSLTDPIVRFIEEILALENE